MDCDQRCLRMLAPLAKATTGLAVIVMSYIIDVPVVLGNSFDAEVMLAAAETRAVRMGNMPRSAKLAVRLQTNVDLAVFLQQERASSPNNQLTPLAEVRGGGDANFTTDIDMAGSYMLLLRNKNVQRTGKVAVQVTAGLQANSSRAVEAAFRKLQTRISDAFVFDRITFDIKDCDVRPHSKTHKVVFCEEFLLRLKSKGGSNEHLDDAVRFSLTRALAKSLILQWGYQQKDTDALAIALLSIFQEQRTIKGALEHEPGEQAKHKPAQMTAWRRWQADSEHADKWLTLLTPHMTHAMQQHLNRRRQHADQY